MSVCSDRAIPRAVRARRPHVRQVAEALAICNDVCIRPLALQRYDTHTGRTETITIPCGATLEAKCPPCAKRNRYLRMAQCREGWHLEEEPATTPEAPDEDQLWLVAFRADLHAQYEAAKARGEDTTDLEAAIAGVDAEINHAGIRGRLRTAPAPKRTRSTRRRRDVPDLPKRRMASTTLGRTFTGTGGKTYRPSLFLSLTLPSYGKVRDGVPVDPDRYDYRKAARDALHFAKLVDRFVQNLRRVAGYDVQYFATVEPQKRLAPHLHMAIRGTLPRAEIRQIVAATYHQVWWPPTGEVRFEGEHLPVWTDGAGYVDPDTGEVLPTWDEALDALDADEDAEPLHVIRFGDQLGVQGVLAGTRDADQCIRYLTKYLTKSLSEAFTPVGEDDAPQRRAQAAHAARLLEALRYEPCSPTCANWLRYGIQPKNAKPGMIPGRCRGKAHTPDHLGYAGRRVLVSRKWSNKTLTEHKHDRRAFVLNLLGLTEEQAADPHRYLWRIPSPGDPDVPPRHARLLRMIAQRQAVRAAMARLRARAHGQPPPQDLSATAAEEVAA
ncbi:replication initiator [Thermostaphylospora chromogena]|uniref:Replication initiation protein n=1 Tax=Thermostaphylospora chromogena TaxID=35622 RepID=A0A1H1FYB7_9ACTN|nr:replication initiator [Thermostaphylospora chromogena]SDR05890.1 hypothetical protein SAMN04489764_3253 [Thermostaphylospora chromogena]